MHKNEEGFLKQIETDEGDDERSSDEARLVFADWLEERGDVRAEYLRLEVKLNSLGADARLDGHREERQRISALAKEIDPRWLRRVERTWGLGLPQRPPNPPTPAPATLMTPAPITFATLATAETLQLASPPQQSLALRIRSSARPLIFCAVFFLLALAVSGCVFRTHLVCHGGRVEGGGGACTIDTYGLLTNVSHIDLPVREIVEVRVDERSPKKGFYGSAKLEIFTRTMGRIDLSGGSGAPLSQYDGATAAIALRQLQSATPKDVDLWVGSQPIITVFAVVFAMLFSLCLGAFVRNLRASR